MDAILAEASRPGVAGGGPHACGAATTLGPRRDLAFRAAVRGFSGSHTQPESINMGLLKIARGEADVAVTEDGRLAIVEPMNFSSKEIH